MKDGLKLAEPKPRPSPEKKGESQLNKPVIVFTTGKGAALTSNNPKIQIIRK